MPRPRLQHSVEHFFFRRFRAAILRRPHGEVRAFGARLGRFGHAVARPLRRLALTNLERVFPQMPADERRRIAVESFQHIGSAFCEALSIERFAADQILDLYEIEGWEHIEAAVDRLAGTGRGFFLHTGHFGHWETSLYPFALRLPPFHALARPPNNPLVGRDLMALRERFGTTVIGKRGAGFKMRDACRQGGYVGTLIDQHIRPSAGVRVPFLGHPAWTSSALALLALRLRVPVVPLACYPAAEPGRYRLSISPPLWGEGRGQEAVTELTRRILADLEDRIRDRPELWMWMHRRWRER